MCGFVITGRQLMAALRLVDAMLGHIAQCVEGHFDSSATLRFLRIGIIGRALRLSITSRIISYAYAISCDQNGWLRQLVGHHQIIAGVVEILPRRDLGPHQEVSGVDAEIDFGRAPS